MASARPTDIPELARFLRDRPEGRIAITGGGKEPSAEAAAALEAERADLLSVTAFDGLVAYEPRDLAVTVGAGMPVATLRATLAGEGQRLPPATPSGADALPGTVGGLVSAAPPGPFDLAHGPLRRHLLACLLVSRDGTACRWGRPVMKNVAGYALPALCAGSHGRLGVLVEASLRTWPIPAAAACWSLEPAAEPASGEPRPGGGEAEADRDAPIAATLGLAVAIAAGPAGETPLPDALAWRWRSDGPAGGRLEARVEGMPEAVEAGGRRLRAWVEARGGRAERRELPDAISGPADGDSGTADGEAGTTDDSDRAVEMYPGRSLRRVVIRLSGAPRHLPELAHRVAPIVRDRDAALEAFPLTGTLRCAWSRDPGSPEGEAVVRQLLVAAGAARVAVERGGPLEHAAAAARRDPETVALEGRILGALAGGPRTWVADYV